MSQPPVSPLFPYTTLFRSGRHRHGDEHDRLEQRRRLRGQLEDDDGPFDRDRKSTRLNSSHVAISYAVFCLKKKIYSSKIVVYIDYILSNNHTCNFCTCHVT